MTWILRSRILTWIKSWRVKNLTWSRWLNLTQSVYLQYNIRKLLKIQESFLINREVHKFNIVIIQKQKCNINDLQSFSSAHNFFHLVKNSSSQLRTCIYVNKHLRLNQWTVKTVELNICLIRILTCNTDDEMQMLKLLNIYNLNSLFIIFIEKFLTISRLNELLKNDYEQLVMKDFNLHHLHWEKWRCFTWYIVIDTLLNIITNVRLKLLLKSDIITRKIHNQFMMIDLIFSSEKIQFITCFFSSSSFTCLCSLRLWNMMLFT